MSNVMIKMKVKGVGQECPTHTGNVKGSSRIIALPRGTLVTLRLCQPQLSHSHWTLVAAN